MTSMQGGYQQQGMTPMQGGYQQQGMTPMQGGYQQQGMYQQQQGGYSTTMAQPTMVQPPATVVNVQPNMVNVQPQPMMVQHYAPPPTQVTIQPQNQSHLWAPPQNQRFAVVFPNGVGYRRSPNYEDRRQDVRGPNNGQIVEGPVVAGTDGLQYVQTAQGYLPVRNPNGETLLGPAQQGVAAPMPQQKSDPMPQPVPQQKSDPSTSTNKTAAAAPQSYSKRDPGAGDAPPAYSPPAQTWTEYTDQATGKPYYHCKETNETTWDKAQTGGQFRV